MEDKTYRCCCVCQKVEYPYKSNKMYELDQLKKMIEIDIGSLSHTYMSKECCKTQPDYDLMKTLSCFNGLPERCTNENQV
jgi:hypothetical protein